MAGRGLPAPGGARWNTPDKRSGAAAGANRDGGAPSVIRCAICKKTKSKEEFSNRQLLKFTSYNKGGRTSKKDLSSVHATCTLCTASQTVELKCCVCDRVKGLDGFAKNQRKDPDNARCIKCVDADIETEPDLPYERDSDASTSDEEEEAHEWDAGATRLAANKVNPYISQKKNAEWALAGDEDDDYDEFEDVSSHHGGPPGQRGYNLPTQPGATQRSSAVFSPRANQPSNSYASYTPPIEDDDGWETMDNSRPIGGSYRAASTASPSGSSSQQTTMRKNGWAKVAKSKGQDGAEEENPWANYNRKK